MDEVVQWYAIRVTYGRELKLKELLTNVYNVECFVATRYKEVEKKDRIVKILSSVISNLIFIYTSHSVLDSIKKELAIKIPMRYIMDKGINKPIVVSNREMSNFITVAGKIDQELIYLDATAPKLKKGERVRVISGLFAGVEGRAVRINKNRCVLISIKGVMSVATAFIHPSLLELIKD